MDLYRYLDTWASHRLHSHSHGAIATAICFSQLIGCMEFSIVVAIAVCEHVRAVQMVIASVIFSSQQIIGCMGFTVSVHLMPSQEQHQIPYSPLLLRKKFSRNRTL